MVLLGGLIPAMAQTREQEADLKAVFIYNFTRYVEWNVNQNESEFIIGIVGNSAIDKPISQIAKTNTVNSKRIIIKHFSRPEDISYCHILFIPSGRAVDTKTILDNVDKGTLTIGDGADMARNGACLNFVLSNDKLKFEANLNALAIAGLKASSQLLKLAIIVN